MIFYQRFDRIMTITMFIGIDTNRLMHYSLQIDLQSTIHLYKQGNCDREIKTALMLYKTQLYFVKESV